VSKLGNVFALEKKYLDAHPNNWMIHPNVTKLLDDHPNYLDVHPNKIFG